MESKIFLKSKTLWGILIMALPEIAVLLGITWVAGDTSVVSQTGDAVFQAIGMILAAYGRFDAQFNLGLTK